jgi:hypothetical protein
MPKYNKVDTHKEILNQNCQGEICLTLELTHERLGHDHYQNPAKKALIDPGPFCHG